MLQHLNTLSGGLRAVGAAARPELLRTALPALARQARCFGFGSHASDNDPEVMEKEKQRNLKGTTKSHIKQVPGWNERLASDSEAVVKADRECPDLPIEEMQKQTVETLQAEAEEEDALPTSHEPQSGAMGA